MFVPQVPFLTYEERLRRGRDLFSRYIPVIGGYHRRHVDDETARTYDLLRLRGFVVQGTLNPTDPSLGEAFAIIDGIGWSYTVMHVHRFCPRVVREFISNKPYHSEQVLIRGHLFNFSPELINRLFMTPEVPHTHRWTHVTLKEAITFLTGGICSAWSGFKKTDMIDPFQTLYSICERNWLPGPDSDAMVKDRLKLLHAIANCVPVNFGHLVYDQVIEMVRVTDSDTSLIFPNLIFQVLTLQHEVPKLLGDEEAIGSGVRIYSCSHDPIEPTEV